MNADGAGMRAQLASHDWAASGLGARAAWPPELRVAVDLMLDARHPALVGWGEQSLIVYNDAYAALFGARHPAALGRPLAEAWPELSLVLAPLAKGALAGAPSHGENGGMCLPGSSRTFDASCAPLRPADGAIMGFFHTAVESSAQLEARSAQRRSEFLAVLAHELRNPMAPIRTGLEIMRLRADSPETIERVREMLERQTRQMTHLIDDLLDVARVTSGKIDIRKQLVDLNRVVSGAVETSSPMIQGARHLLDVELWNEPLLLDIDPTRIAQVVDNLLGNAAKYTPPGGQLRLKVSKEAGSAVVSVSDSGMGIAPEHRDTIFEMFNQVGREGGMVQGGLGIGLALVRQLVMLHGGSIAASSPGPGQGSTFTVRLPLGVRRGAGEQEPTLPDRRATSRRTFRIMVVDDNTDAAESLSLLLQMNAHDIRTANNGRDALALAAEFRPDVAFLDIGMPGMTGFELATRLRAMPELARLTIVAVTGWGSEEDQACSREAGIDHHYTKPIAAETVSRLLARID